MTDDDQQPLQPASEDETNDKESIALQDDYYDEPRKFERAFDYIETDKGHEITQRVVKMAEDLLPVAKTLLEAKIEIQKASPRLEFWKWVILLLVRFLVFVAAVGSLIYMRRTGNIDPAIALLIGGLVAYFFGYVKRQS